MISRIERFFTLSMPVGEKMIIWKHHMEGDNPKKRLSIVTGIHGDEMEGQYACYEVIRRIKENPDYLEGVVDVYPALNPLGLDMGNRYVPGTDMDLNRIFPGNPDGTYMDQVADAIVTDLLGSDLCIDMHASDMYVREIPQVRVSDEFADRLIPYARLTNVDMIWVNATATVHESTLAHSLNYLQVPTLVMEMGLGMRIDREVGNQVVDGIFNLMKEMGIWTGPVTLTHLPAESTDGEVGFFRAENTGVFLPSIEHNHFVPKGVSLGKIVDVLSGEELQDIVTPRSGLVFTLREYPFVYKGALLARILWQEEE